MKSASCNFRLARGLISGSIVDVHIPKQRLSSLSFTIACMIYKGLCGSQVDGLAFPREVHLRFGLAFFMMVLIRERHGRQGSEQLRSRAACCEPRSLQVQPEEADAPFSLRIHSDEKVSSAALLPLMPRLMAHLLCAR